MRRIRMNCTYNLGRTAKLSGAFKAGHIYDEDEMPEGTLDRFVKLGRGELIPEPKINVETKMEKPPENKSLVKPKPKEEEKEPRKKRATSKRKRLVNS